ncbi:MAG: SusC/RagA family TonB-linked outer membrane protein [Dysgonamonadaceae bacterium]|jgi:TonB-linked SusC/RagA family outer membrane protein|nr:SusC/RagA family TonB-linked outer membrane protein [Dysgonamonadaceae bacterium]
MKEKRKLKLKLLQIMFALLAPTLLLAQTNAITLRVTDMPLGEVVKELTRKTGKDFVFSNREVNTEKRLTIDMTDRPLEEVLKAVFGDRFRFEITSKIVAVQPVNVPRTAAVASDPKPEIALTGTVKDMQKAPMEGVTVYVKGTTIGTITDDEGIFSLSFPVTGKTTAIVFSYLGMKTQEIVYIGQKSLDITLEDEINEIEEVMVTGYQTLKRERVSGSFAKPNLEVVQDRSNSMNVLDRLDGLVPGLTVNNAPGADNFLIRGVSSIYGNRSPLYVVDGVQIDDLSSVNPQDVEDVTVLRDATAASIWGSRAANGVIVISTKKGKANGKLNITYDGFINFQGKPDLNYLPGLSSQQYITAAREIFDPSVYPYAEAMTYVDVRSIAIPPHEQILYDEFNGVINTTVANARLDSLSSINNLGQIKDLWFRNATLMNHSVALSGGNELFSVYGSMSYTDAKNNRPGEQDNTYKINLRQDFNPSKKIHFYLISDLTNNITEAKRAINIGNRFYPYQLFQDASGNNLSIPYLQYFNEPTRTEYEEKSGINLNYNPLDEFNYGYTKSDEFIARVTGGASLTLFPGLKFEGIYGYVKGSRKISTYDDEKSYLVRSEVVQFTDANTPGKIVYYLPEQGGTYSINNLNTTNWTVRNQLIYDKEFSNKHQFTLLVGQEAQDQTTTTSLSKVRGYNERLQSYVPIDYTSLAKSGFLPNPVAKQSYAGSVLASNDYFQESEIQTRFVSYYSNVAYTYDRKYSVNGSWRIDRSNLFGKDKSAQNKPVWSFGFKWLISEEDFMKSPSFLNLLALRTTYGITGNAPTPGQAASYDILVTSTSTFFPAGGLSIGLPGNTKLSWESTGTLNIGLDFSVMNDRFIGSIDYYSKKTTNLFGPLVTNVFSGYSSVFGNVGDMSNKGIEFSLKSSIIQTNDFSWNNMFVLSYNKNIITKINSETPIATASSKIEQQFLEGFPAYAIFAYKYAGLDDMGDPQIYLANGEATKQPNVAQPEDVVCMGTAQPVWNGGFSNTFRYKRISLSANIVYSLGHVMRKPVNTFYTGRLTQAYAVASYMNNYSFTGNVSAEFADRWKSPGDEAFTNIPSYVAVKAESDSRRNVEYYTYADINVVSASSIRLRDITLSYKFPKIIITKISANFSVPLSLDRKLDFVKQLFIISF